MYDRKFRKEVVEEARAVEPGGIAEVARQRGVHPATVARWVRTARRRKPARKVGPLARLESAVSSLEKVARDLKQIAQLFMHEL